MVDNVLSLLKPELALNTEADGIASGTYVGYGYTLRELRDKSCLIFNSWVRKSALTTKSADDFFKDYMSKPENSFLKAYKAGEPNISAVLFIGDDASQSISDIKRFITDIVKYYSANYYSNACSKCNSSIGLTFAKVSDGNVKQLCKMCLQSEKDAAESMAEKAAMAQRQSSPAQPTVNSQPVQPQAMPNQRSEQNVGLYGIPVGDRKSVV